MRERTTICAAALALMTVASAARADLKVLTSPKPPFVGPDGTSGIVVAIARTLFERAGVDYAFLERPKGRAVALAKRKHDHCALPIQRTQARERDYAWVSPVFVNRYALYAKSAGADVSVLADAAGKRIAVTQGSASARYLKTVGFDLKIRRVPSVMHGVKMLRAGRIDFLAANTVTAPRVANRLKTKVHGAIVFRTTLQGLGCNKKISKKVLTTMQNTLREMYADGTVKDIVEKHTTDLNVQGLDWYR